MLPEPIFRQSTGELVQPSETVPTDPEPDTLEPVNPSAPEPQPPVDPLAKFYDPPVGYVEPPAPTPAPPPAVAVEPQPFISEQFSAEKVLIETEKPKAKSSVRPMLLAIGGLVFLAIAGGAIAVIYFLFFAGRSNSSGF